MDKDNNALYRTPEGEDKIYYIPEAYTKYKEGSRYSRRTGRLAEIHDKLLKAKMLERERQEQTRQCDVCKETKPLKKNFFKSRNPLMPGGRIGVCSKCLNELFDYEDPIDFQYILMYFYLPFLEDLYFKAMKEEYPLGKYLQNLGMNQYKNYEGVLLHRFLEYTTEIDNNPVESFKDSLSDEEKAILRVKWGDMFTEEERIKLEMFCNDMKADYDIGDAAIEDYLKKIAMISIMMERAIKEEEYVQFKNLNQAYDKLMQSAKFSENQKDTHRDNVNCFAVFVDHLETNGFMPTKIEEEADIVDQTEQNIFEWTRDLVLGETELRNQVESALKHLQKTQSEVMSNIPHRQHEKIKSHTADIPAEEEEKEEGDNYDDRID